MNRADTGPVASLVKNVKRLLGSVTLGDRNLFSLQARLNDDGSSFSGHERDRLFLSQGGASFVNLSGISGLDHPGDGRSVAIIDYDGDGWQDLAVVSANAPFMNLFRNGIGDPSEQRAEGHFLALKFVGGNALARASSSASARDAFGTRVELQLGDRIVRREHFPAQGRASQNSAVMFLGMGKELEAGQVRVYWPSGNLQTLDSVPADSLVTVYEDPAQGPEGVAFWVRPYRQSVAVAPDRRVEQVPIGPKLELADRDRRASTRLTMYTSVSSTCVACRKELPILRELRASFEPEDLAIHAVPYDLEETERVLPKWMGDLEPPYDLLHVTPEELGRFMSVQMSELGNEGLPVSIITDRQGNVLFVGWGPPSVSKIRELLRGLRAS